MEAVNKTIENALHFIAVVQENCDRKRFLLEQLNLKCYNTYLKDRKIEQKELKKAKQQAIEVNNCASKEEKEDKSLNEIVEELMLADLLLEKARSIRNKNMICNNQAEPICATLPQVDSYSNDAIKSDLVSSERRNASGISKVKKNTHAVLPRSKSATNSVPVKASLMTYSKSYHENIHRKDITISKTVPSTKLKTLLASPDHKQSLPKESGVSVISKEELSEMKNLCTNNEVQKDCQNELLQNGQHSRSDSPQSAIHHPFLTYQSFKKSFKNTCSLKDFFQLKEDRFWYPYLNSKNRRYLSEQTRSSALESVSNVIKLVNKIQEMMFWIDLMSLIGKEVLPKLKFLDEKDRNVAQLCSYLSSIYRENLQRLAMLSLD